jgi:hypothetical protein
VDARVTLLTQHADGFWSAEGLVRFMGMDLRSRMELVRLPAGGLMAISPLALTPALKAEIDALGVVRHILSPVKIHNLGISGFAEAWPDAQVWASPGLPERRKDLRFDGVLGDAPHPDWAGVLDQTTTAGNSFFSEVVFLHRASRTLIVADLIEALDAHTLPTRRGRFVARLMRLFGRTLPSPEFRAFTTDIEAAKERLDRIDRWDFTRILPAHGPMLDDPEHATFRQVRDFLLAEVRARPRWRRALYRLAARWE